MDRKKIKAEAKELIRGKWFLLFVLFLVVGALGSLTLGILTPVLMFGVYLIIQDLFNRQEIDINRMKEPFKDLNHAFSLVVVNILFSLLVLGGTLLFVVPGIIFSYRYKYANLLMMDDPRLAPVEALKKSRAMMKGHKLERFILDLSFIGHMLLTALTFGIHGIYFIPLQKVTDINYYNHLKAVQTVEHVEPEIID